MADVELRLVADVDNAVKGIGSLSKEYQGLVNQLAKPLKQVNAFRELESSLEGTERQTRSARDRVRELGDELARTAEPSKQLTAQYRDAVNELRRLERAEGTAQQQLARRRRELQAAGIDTRNLVTEQQRLSKELQGALGAGQADQRLRSAQSNLGVGEIEQTQRQLVELRNEYRLVMAEGDLSAKQRAEAEANYRRSVAQTLAALRQLRAASAPGPSRNDAQAALQAEAAAAADAAEQQRRLDAQRALGVGRIEQTQQSLVALRAQYREVMADASLSGRERAEAETVYHQRVRQTLAELRNMRAAIADQGTQAQRAAAAELQRSQAAREGIRAQTAALAQLAREQRASNIEAARQNLGVSRYRDLQAEIGRLRGQYQLLRSSGNLTTQELAVAQRSLTTRVRETQQALRDMNAEQRRGAGALSGIGVVAGLYAAGRGLRGLTNTADQWVEINDRIRLASESQADHAQGMERLREISDRTYTDMKNNAELYIGSLSVLRERGFTNADALNLTEALGLGLVASAAKGERAAQVIDQINKALQDGELKGDAFNAVIRNTPALADALARSLGVTREQLAGLAKDGELTTDVWVPALISQVDSLGAAVDGMQVTVGDALTRLNNAWEEAIGTADTKPLIRAIEELTKVISDPVVVDNLVALASALVTLAATAAEGGSEFVDMGKRIGFIAANATGSVAELDKLDQQIKDIDRSLAGTGFNRTLAGLWYSKEELQAQRQALVAMRALLVTELTGMSDEQRQIEEDRRAETERQNSAALGEYRKYIGELETLRQSQIKAAEKGAKALVAAEKKATADIQKVRDERLAIDQRYQQALADIQRGPGGEPSLMQYNALRRGAQAALDNGDIAGAQKQAQAALKVLQDLAAAGESTVGFSFFVRELRDIEMAANDLEESNAEDKLASIRDEMQQLKDQAAQLKEMPVSVKTDDATIEQVRTTIETLVAQLSQKEVVIPVRVLMPDIAGGGKAEPSISVPALATGGILRGPGTGTSDSILMWGSNGEGVVNARAVQYYGANLIHQLNSLRVPRFATGGVLGPVPVPSIPSLAPALQQQLASGSGGGSNEDWGSMVIDLGNGPAPIRMPRSTAEALRREALKRGSPGRAR